MVIKRTVEIFYYRQANNTILRVAFVNLYREILEI